MITILISLMLFKPQFQDRICLNIMDSFYRYKPFKLIIIFEKYHLTVFSPFLRLREKKIHYISVMKLSMLQYYIDDRLNGCRRCGMPWGLHDKPY